MKKFTTVLPIAILFLTSLTAHADAKFLCAEASTGLQTTLTVTGAGRSASLHLENILMSGDCTLYPQAPEMDGYLAFLGTFTNRIDNPPTQLQGVFLFQEDLLNGKPANMRRFGPDGFMTTPCVLQK